MNSKKKKVNVPGEPQPLRRGGEPQKKVLPEKKKLTNKKSHRGSQGPDVSLGRKRGQGGLTKRVNQMVGGAKEIMRKV